MAENISTSSMQHMPISLVAVSVSPHATRPAVTGSIMDMLIISTVAPMGPMDIAMTMSITVTTNVTAKHSASTHAPPDSAPLRPPASASAPAQKVSAMALNSASPGTRQSKRRLNSLFDMFWTIKQAMDIIR